MASTTEIANLSLSHIGVGKPIANLDTEQSEPAEACRRFYEISKRATLADLDWSFATKCAVLNLVQANPNTEWQYSYRYPVDAIALRRILSETRNDTSKTRIPYKVTRDAVGKLIYTDKLNAEAEYTENINDPGFFTSEFSLALSFRLAYYIAPRLTKGDPFKLQREVIQFYNIELSQAKRTNINEQVPDLPPESEFITIRS